MSKNNREWDFKESIRKDRMVYVIFYNQFILNISDH